MTSIKLVVAFLAGLFCGSTIAGANDTSAAIGVGGLQFKQSHQIEMLSEELFISKEQVVVKYRFRNLTSSDLVSLVAFPLPDVSYTEDGQSLSTSDFSFTTLVNGISVVSKVEQHAMLHGNDESQTLMRLNVPLDPVAAVDAISEAAKGDLKQWALLDDDGHPTWALKTTYYWEQRFPANQEIMIEHRYKPVLGGTVQTIVGTEYFTGELRNYYDRFCIDRSFVSAVKSAANGGKPQEIFSESHIAYILTTGANWAGPIRNLRVVVDKGLEENLVSFCGDGVRQISPTQFEFTAQNFVPKSELYILILQRIHPPNESVSPNTIDDFASLDCGELWIKRNSIFKAGGYCFKSPRAIAQFGNAGCTFDSEEAVPLSEVDRSTINEIRLLEARKRCSR